MKLYLLRPIHGDTETGNWNPWYDKCFGYVIRAESKERARQIADENAGDENRAEFMGASNSDTKNPWLSSDHSSCIELSDIGDEEMVIQDFRAA